MALLEGYVVTPALYQSETGPEAAVGDQVKLFLNVDADPGYPEYIYATIQHPIEPVNCGSATSYIFEYDPADLLVPNSLLLIGDIIGDVYVVSQADLIAEGLAAEIVDRTAADIAVTAAAALDATAKANAAQAAAIAACPPENATTVAAVVNGTAEVTTPADANTLPMLVAGALRWVTWVNAWTNFFKGKADALYVALTGNQTVAGAKTLSGQLELTNQAATNPTSAMTRDLVMSLLGSEKYIIFRDDWFNTANWNVFSTGGGYIDSTSFSADATNSVTYVVGGTTNSYTSVRLGNYFGTSLQDFTSWEFVHRIKLNQTTDCVCRIGFYSDAGAVLTASTTSFTGFEYDSSKSANWRYYDSASAAYQDTGIAASTAWIKFKIRRGPAYDQLYWSVNGGSETLVNPARVGGGNIGILLQTLANSGKYLYNDYTSFVATTAR